MAVRRRPSSDSASSSDSACGHGARKAVEQEAVAGLVGVHPLGDHARDQVVGHQIAPVHVLLGLPAELRLLLHRPAQDVAGGVVGKVEVLPEARGLGALAGARRAEQDEVELAHGGGQATACAEMGTDGARIPVLVGHHVEPLESVLAEAVAPIGSAWSPPSSSSSQPPEPSQPCASSHDLHQKRRCRPLHHRARAAARIPGRRAAAGAASPWARMARLPSTRPLCARDLAAADRPASPQTPRRRCGEHTATASSVQLGRDAPAPLAAPRPTRPRPRPNPCTDPPPHPPGRSSEPRPGCASASVCRRGTYTPGATKHLHAAEC